MVTVSWRRIALAKNAVFLSSLVLTIPGSTTNHMRFVPNPVQPPTVCLSVCSALEIRTANPWEIHLPSSVQIIKERVQLSVCHPKMNYHVNYPIDTAPGDN